MEKKDYYDILCITKGCTDEDVKRAYKKLAIQFHPDKNKSTHSEEAFKKVNNILNKISHAFTTLKDPEKRIFYDKYGSEEELREKYAQQNAQRYQEEDIDPFDLFEMFFTGGNVHFQRGNRVYRRRQQHHEPEEGRQNPMPRRMLLVQLLPFLIIILFSVVPYFFTSVR
jgi:DnaJ family protein B protein 12